MVQELIKTYLHRSYDGETGQFYTSANILTAVGLMKHHNYFLYTHSLYENMWQLWRSAEVYKRTMGAMRFPLFCFRFRLRFR